MPKGLSLSRDRFKSLLEVKIGVTVSRQLAPESTLGSTDRHYYLDLQSVGPRALAVATET